MSDGHPSTLVPFEPGNTAAVKSGAFSERVLSPRIEQYRAELLTLPWMQPVDEIAVGEVARLLARIEAIDADLDERGHFGKAGARSLLDHRARLSRELRAWTKHLGALPSERAAWAAQLGSGGLAGEIARRRAAREGGSE